MAKTPTEAALLRTPLHDAHIGLGATMVPFAGYAMPLQYSTIRDEHLAVRGQAGLFDLSHMGEVRLSGPGAAADLQRLITNDLSRIAPGGALYSVMCNEAGGIVDDVIVYRDADDDFLVVVNASRRDVDVAWIRDHASAKTQIDDVSDSIALIAVQGPASSLVVDPLLDAHPHGLPPFHHTRLGVSGTPARVARTGYTGEDGLELYVASDRARQVWDALLDAGRRHGLRPTGLGARDTLRLEAGLRLYGQDMDDSIDPYSAGLGWTVKRDKGTFVGSEALARINPARPPHSFVGLAVSDRAIPRHGQAVHNEVAMIGEVTSGTFSFSLGHGIATARLTTKAGPGDQLSLDVRGRRVPATVVPLPFYRRPRQES